MNWIEALTTAAREGCAYVMLNRSRFTLLDEEDLEIVGPYFWRATRANKKKRLYVRGYKIGESKSKQVRMHRMVMNAPTGVVVDHRNLNTMDNRKHNLRFCSSGQNSHNAVGKHMAGRTSKFKGVSDRSKSHGPNIKKPWYAEGRANGVRTGLGCFTTEIEAARAYNEWAKVAHGDFALLNDV